MIDYINSLVFTYFIQPIPQIIEKEFIEVPIPNMPITVPIPASAVEKEKISGVISPVAISTLVIGTTTCTVIPHKDGTPIYLIVDNEEVRFSPTCK